MLNFDPRIQRASFAAILLGCLSLYAWGTEVELDDAHIYFRVAENWLAGHGPRFNLGDRHMPITGVGWLLILTAVKGTLPQIGLSTIAKVLGIAEGTVKSRIHRARKAMREQLKELLGTPAAEGL